MNLAERLKRHSDFCSGLPGGVRFDAPGEDLNWANLNCANLSDANLNCATGNMREIKTSQFDQWGITWTRSPEGIDYLQIGCQRHQLEKWKNADPRWITAMDPAAPEWWEKYGQFTIQMVELSPAVAWGHD
jgi:hypothetical protein